MKTEGQGGLPLRKLLRQFGIRPKHRLGQHFLVDERLLQRIAQEAQAGPTTWCWKSARASAT